MLHRTSVTPNRTARNSSHFGRACSVSDGEWNPAESGNFIDDEEIALRL